MAHDTLIPAAPGFYFIPVPRDGDAAAQRDWNPHDARNRRAIIAWALADDLRPRPPDPDDWTRAHII
jgi:hypothetical protein